MSTRENKNQKEITMNFKKGYELDRLVAKLRIRGMNTDADKLAENRSTNGLSMEATQIVEEEARYAR
jgi:hypothetical protein